MWILVSYGQYDEECTYIQIWEIVWRMCGRNMGDVVEYRRQYGDYVEEYRG